MLVPPEVFAFTVLVWGKCSLTAGAYRYVVYASDAAGNTQVKAGGNKLTVL